MKKFLFMIAAFAVGAHAFASGAIMTPEQKVAVAAAVQLDGQITGRLLNRGLTTEQIEALVAHARTQMQLTEGETARELSVNELILLDVLLLAYADELCANNNTNNK